MLHTRLTEAWGLRYPLIQAPMWGAGGGALAAAVSAAGGLGMLGVGSTAAAGWVEEEAERARAAGRFGIGLMAWALERRPELLEAALAARPFAVAISFGDPAPYVARVHAAGAHILCQVQDGASARRALAAGVDALVAQGTEAGGHTGSVGTLPLLQVVLDLGDRAGVPVLAAGGIGSGRGIAGVLAMGAAGAWLGTRFAATTEALGTDRAKAAIVRASEAETVHTHVFDIVQGLPWPATFPGRALANNFTARWHGREDDLIVGLPDVRAAFDAARARGDVAETHVYAGQAAGLIDEVLPAAALVERLMAEAESVLRRSLAMLGDAGGTGAGARR